MRNLPKLGDLATGQEVFDRYNSHLHQGVVDLLPEVFGNINLDGEEFEVIEVNLGRVIGETICVSTGPEDQIVFAKRPKRYGHTRFVLDREPEPCSTVIVILKKADRKDYYVLITAFIGGKPEPEPWDRNATERSAEFWDNHALILGYEEIISGTETTQCPW